MTSLPTRCRLIIGLALLLLASSVQAASEIRVLIDVSGSMKHNDPGNLRKPALRLLVGLLPQDTDVGAWLFAESVRVLLKPAKVDSKWKSKAEKSAAKIHSRGQFTDIEKALAAALKGWETSDGKVKRSIILLTDGMVDVSKKAEKSAASRARILNKQLPVLQQQGITLHAIALSENTDQELMKSLSVGTDGGYEMAKNAEALQRMFLHMFEKATDVETLPLKDNRFQVDNSINELSLLVFREEGAEPTRIILPDGSEVSAEKKPSAVRWRSEKGHDLITFDKPVGGEWRINAAIDPDNRVMIVTDLKIKVTELPNHILAGEKFDFEMELLAKETRITRKDFLSFVHAKLIKEDSHGDSSTLELVRNDDGLFTLLLDKQFAPGEYQFTTRVDSETFQRQKSQSVKVHKSPMKTSLDTTGNNEAPVYTIKLNPIPELVDASSLQIETTLVAQDDSEQEPQFMAQEGGVQLLELRDLPPGQYKLMMSIKGKTPRGREFESFPEPVVFGEKVDLPPPEPVEVEEESKEEPPKETEVAEPEPEPEPEIEEEEVDWIMTVGVVAGVNILLILLGVGGYLYWRKRSAKAESPEDEL